MKWLELDQVIASLTVVNAGYAVFSLASWLLPAPVVAAIACLGLLFVVSWVLTSPTSA